MIIDCIADLHGFYPILEGGDLLIVAGDLTARDTDIEYKIFLEWIYHQNYSKKIVIAGNHDNYLVNNNENRHLRRLSGYDKDDIEFEYLCDSGTEVVTNCNPLKIWGSPWTKTFEGMNPRCKAFTCDTEEELAEKWTLIPEDTDILITHSPSFGNYDWVKNRDGSIGQSVGSLGLWMKMLCMVPRLKLHVTGHIHEAYGQSKHANGIHLVNASHVNERYEPVNKPIRIEYER